MTIELWMLFWVVVSAFVQMLIAAQGVTMQVGLATLAGNREDMPAMPGWKGRAERGYRNMLEYLPLFAVVVLVVHVTATASTTSAIGAQLYLLCPVGLHRRLPDRHPGAPDGGMGGVHRRLDPGRGADFVCVGRGVNEPTVGARLA